MNDFTKEELETILNWGEVYTEFGRSWTDKIHRPFMNKIQSMLDDYCEHECPEIRHVNAIEACPICGKHHE